MKKETLELGNAIQDDIDTITTLLAAFPEGEVTVEPETISQMMRQIGNVDILSVPAQDALNTLYAGFFTSVKSCLSTFADSLGADLEALQDAPDDPAEG